MRDKDKQLYMDIALRVAKQSYAVRLKVGAVLVTKSGMISVGYNGTYPGDDNCCEDKIEVDSKTPLNGTDVYDPTTGKYFRLVTKPDVYHAEVNVFNKMMQQGVSAKDASLFVSHAPCLDCSKLILSFGVSSVYYHELYRLSNGLEFLSKHGVYIEQV